MSTVDRAAHTSRVNLGDRSYDVIVGADLLAQVGSFLAGFAVRRGVIFADERLESRTDTLSERLRDAGWEIVVASVPASEELKSMAGIAGLYDRLIAARVDRSATIFALGGGTIGDAVGYVAATYQRGLRWVGIPTTLLAQVDSAIGGKTAINHPAAKNAIGLVHQPSLVLCDTTFVQTLDERDRVSGHGEMVKYGLIADAALYRALLDRTMPLDASIAACVEIKARLVERDEQDRTGARAVLNFGHTIGHAIEQSGGYGTLRHGEAVIYGMRAAVALSAIRGHLDETIAAAIERDLSAISVPPITIDPAEIIAAVRHDKKRGSDGRVNFVLLRAIGETLADNGVHDDDIVRALARISP